MRVEIKLSEGKGLTEGGERFKEREERASLKWSVQHTAHLHCLNTCMYKDSKRIKYLTHGIQKGTNQNNAKIQYLL